MALDEQLFLAGEKRNEGVIGRVVGDLAQFAFEVGHVEVDFSVPHAGKVQPLAVRRPKEGIYAAVEAFGDVTFLTGTQFIDAEACAVAFIAVALHAAPRNVLAIGRELGVLVVADVGILAVLRIDRLILETAGVICLARCGPTFGFAEVARGFLRDVVEEDVAVGGGGVVAACFLATGVSNLPTVGTPSQLFVTAERHHGRFERFAFQQILLHGDFLPVEVCQERVGRCGDVLIPVLVHQIVDDHAGGFGKVFFFRGDRGVLFHLFDENHAFAVGREEEVLHVVGFVADLSAVTAVGAHDPKLVTAAFGRKISDLLFVADLDPHGTALAVSGSGEALRMFGLEIQQIKHAVRFVFRHAVVSDGIHGSGTGRIGLHTADASHGPKGFGRHTVGFQGRCLPADESLRTAFRGNGAGEGRETQGGSDHESLERHGKELFIGCETRSVGARLT